jgi:hypothetical protein
MTLHELLHQVSFDEIVPFIERYHGWNALAMYKIHYDYLRHLTPKQGEEATATVSNGEPDESWPEPHLSAFPLEGDCWEHSLAKKLIIEPNVKASLAEIAMCCLWHTSFYGFTEEQMDERFENLDYYADDMLDSDIIRLRAKHVIRAVEVAGGRAPSIKEHMKVPAFRNKIRSKCKEMRHRRMALMKAGIRRSSMRSYAHHIIRKEYYYRIWVASDIVKAMLKSPMTHVEDIGPLLLCNHMQSYSTSSAYPFRMEETSIIECIASRCSGTNAFYVYTDDNLDQDMRMITVFYE